MLDTAIDTIVMRPYVFSFFVAYLLACVPHVGWYKTLIFTVIGYAIAFSSENSPLPPDFHTVGITTLKQPVIRNCGSGEYPSLIRSPMFS